ncbi:MAG TPA: transposase, partial [Chloroflexota bacterium]|nr:transposase [Chloroflexota bacterium]
TTGDFEREVRVTQRIASGYAGNCAPETGMARITALLERSPDVSSLAALHGTLGQLLMMTGRYQEAWSATQRADELARESGDGYARLTAASSRMHLLIKLGRMGEALPLAADIVHLAEDLGELPLIMGLHRDLAFNLAARGEFESARAHIDRASAAVGQTGRHGDFMMVTAVRGWLAFLRGNWPEARADLEEAATPSGWGNGSWYATYPLVFLAHLRLAEGDVPAAAAAGNQALALADQSSDLQGRRWASAVLAEVDLAQGNAGGALARLQPLLDRGGLEEGDVTDFLPALARTYLDTGQIDQARDVAARAIARARAGSAKPVLTEALRAQALIAMRRNEWQLATQSLGEGLALARSIRYPYAEARILVELGLLDRHQGKPDGARERLAGALALFQRLGATRDVERTAEILEAIACSLGDGRARQEPAPTTSSGPITSRVARAASSQNSPRVSSQYSAGSVSQNTPAAPSRKERDAEMRLTDTKWARIAALLPPRRPGRGRPRADNRQTLEAILYVRRTGCAWGGLPSELGSSATAHRRWKEWQAAGLWDQIVALAETLEPETGEERHAPNGVSFPLRDRM